LALRVPECFAPGIAIAAQVFLPPPHILKRVAQVGNLVPQPVNQFTAMLRRLFRGCPCWWRMFAQIQ
jgi:hypothetical protein